jgi:hypothetical protein
MRWLSQRFNRDVLLLRYRDLEPVCSMGLQELEALNARIAKETRLWSMLSYVGLLIWPTILVSLIVFRAKWLSDSLFIVGTLISFGVLLVLSKAYVKWVERPLVLRLLNCCRTCGYDLTGNASGVCPECGRAVESNGVE